MLSQELGTLFEAEPKLDINSDSWKRYNTTAKHFKVSSASAQCVHVMPTPHVLSLFLCAEMGGA